MSGAPGADLVTRLSDVAAEPVWWLWEPYIPRRKLTLLEGDPGDGKTFLAITIAAAVTRGTALPGDPPDLERKPRTVLYWTCEDGVGDTIRPRFDAAGGDAERLFVLNAERGDGSLLTLDDTAELRAACEEVEPALLVVDPLQGAIGAKVNAHRANEVRPRLTRLKLLAERFDCAALVIRHLSKAPTSRAVHRGLGSIDFAAAARSILLVGRDPDDDERRGFVQTKCSLARHGPSLDFTISDGAVTWSPERSKMTAAIMLSGELSGGDRSALEEAAEFIAETLADGPVAAADVFKDADRRGIASRTLKRAKAKLAVRSEKRSDGWWWSARNRANGPNADGGTVDPLRESPGTSNNLQERQGGQRSTRTPSAPLPNEEDGPSEVLRL